LDGILIAAIVAFAGIIGPAFLAWVNGNQRRAEKLEDYRREDEVAAKAAEQGKLIVASVVANTAEIASNSITTNGKLDVIHTLVNSNMTQAMQAELDATIAQLVLMREVIDMKKASGVVPSEDTVSAISIIEKRIAELTVQLQERSSAANTVVQQQQQQQQGN